MSRPRILVTPDVTVRQSIGVDYRFYELKAAYVDAVLAAGGLPVVAVYSQEQDVVDGYLDAVAGVLLTGGDFDVDPRLFGAPPHPRLGTLKPERTQFERAIFQGARRRNLPILGVCGGMQLINVEQGGTLWQDLPDERPESLPHSQKHDRRHPAHDVNVAPGTRTHAAVGLDVLQVNTSHHQAVRTLGRDVVASGTSPDGLVEALELASGAWCVGVQWHPETLLGTKEDPTPGAVYKALVQQAVNHGKARA